MSELVLIIGKKASGKSVETKNTLLNITNKNAVIFDICLEHTYEEFDVIQPSEVASFLDGKEGKVARIIPVVNGDRMTIIEIKKMILDILDNVKNGILVLESIRMYKCEEIYEKIKTFIQNKNTDTSINVSIICAYQSVATTPVDFINNASLIKLHRQIEGIERYKNHISPFKILKIAFLLVQNKSKDDKYFFCEINSATTITGNFSKSDYRNACLDYIIEVNGLHRYSEHY